MNTFIGRLSLKIYTVRITVEFQLQLLLTPKDYRLKSSKVGKTERLNHI